MSSEPNTGESGRTVASAGLAPDPLAFLHPAQCRSRSPSAFTSATRDRDGAFDGVRLLDVTGLPRSPPRRTPSATATSYESSPRSGRPWRQAAAMTARSCHHAHIQVTMTPLAVTISDDCQWQMALLLYRGNSRSLELWQSARLISVPVGADFLPLRPENRRS
ncbi:hypothetical protein OG698_09280 [Streptomyces sp. NBC_01003]|uniref:hypothetical protein n=1 Tax=Streptomyces sp. NBC_01003 TaxID=2903714 RepID=UPI003867F34F|nr:hypothetical protein OG698_09280 [Streptomyces sp. NBC_01003]